MSTQLDARRRLSQHAQGGNWRLKGLLLAAMNEGASRKDYAHAWPSSKNPSDYRILSQHATRDAEMEADRKVIAQQGSDRHRILKDYAGDNDAIPKTLGAAKPKEITDDGRTLGAPLDDTIKRVLFASSTNEEVNTLFREQLLETVMEGARTAQFARDVSTIQNVNTPSGDVTIEQDDDSGRRTAEGAEIRDDGKGFTTLDWDCAKLTKGSRVTDEMVDTAMIDLMEYKVRRTGRAVENSVNEVFFTNSVDDAVANGSVVEFDSTLDDPGYQAINSAYGQIDRQRFTPEYFTTSPGFRTEVFSNDALRFANRSGSDDVVRERAFDPLLDLEHVAADLQNYDTDGRNVGGSGGANTWEFTDESGAAVSDGIGCLLHNSEHNHLFLYAPNGNDIEVKDYDDPIRDITGFNARIWADQDYSQARSAAVIQQPT